MNDIDTRIRKARTRVNAAREVLEDAREAHAEAVDELETLEAEKDEANE